VIADSGPIISLALVDELELLTFLFNDIKIPIAAWNELTIDESRLFYQRIHDFFENKVALTKGSIDLAFVMDHGEAESVTLYQELQADFLLIDDRKARAIAESLNINCIGTLGILLTAKDKGRIDTLRSIFKQFLKNKRFYSLQLLNRLLEQAGEEKL
jgi:predicted nucleic acid-binding protein